MGTNDGFHLPLPVQDETFRSPSPFFRLLYVATSPHRAQSKRLSSKEGRTWHLWLTNDRYHGWALLLPISFTRSLIDLLVPCFCKKPPSCFSLPHFLTSGGFYLFVTLATEKICSFKWHSSSRQNNYYVLILYTFLLALSIVNLPYMNSPNKGEDESK